MSKAEKDKSRFIEDVSLELSVAKINVTVQAVDPPTKSVEVSGEYADYLLAKKLGARFGWKVGRAVTQGMAATVALGLLAATPVRADEFPGRIYESQGLFLRTNPQPGIYKTYRLLFNDESERDKAIQAAKSRIDRSLLGLDTPHAVDGRADDDTIVVKKVLAP